MPKRKDPVKAAADALRAKAVRLRNLAAMLTDPGIPSKRNRTALRNTMEEVLPLLIDLERAEKTAAQAEEPAPQLVPSRPAHPPAKAKSTPPRK